MDSALTVESDADADSSAEDERTAASAAAAAAAAPAHQVNGRVASNQENLTATNTATPNNQHSRHNHSCTAAATSCAPPCAGENSTFFQLLYKIVNRVIDLKHSNLCTCKLTYIFRRCSLLLFIHFR